MTLYDRSDATIILCLLSVVAGHKAISFRLAALSIIEPFISQNNPTLLKAIRLCDIYDFFVSLGAIPLIEFEWKRIRYLYLVCHMEMAGKFESHLAVADSMAVLTLHLLKEPVQDCGDLMNQSFHYLFDIYTLTQLIDIALRRLEFPEFLPTVCQLLNDFPTSFLNCLFSYFIPVLLNYLITELPNKRVNQSSI
jgi:hypothetical protein